MGQETTGTVTGRVTSKAGAPLQGAVVRLSSPALLGERTAITDAKGGYRIPLLPGGEFTVTITMKDFATSKGNFRVVAGQTSHEDGVLTPMNEVAKEQAAVVVVESTMGQRDKTETVTQSIFSEEEMMKITQTDIFALAYLAPGVTADGKNINSPSIRGGSNVGTKILLNGSQVNDGAFANWTVNPTIPDMLESMAVIQSPLNARYGGTDSGIMSWVTTRGSNEFAGTLRRSYSRNYWNGANLYTNPDRLGNVYAKPQAPEGQQNGEWQATLRGPIWKDHITFAYATRIFPDNNTPISRNYYPNSPTDLHYTGFTIPGTTTTIGNANLGDFDGKTLPYQGTRSWNQYVLFAQLNENHQVDFSYTQDNQRYTDYRSDTPGGTGTDRYWTSFLSIGYKGIIGSSGVLDARYGQTKRTWSYPVSSDPNVTAMVGQQINTGSGWVNPSNVLQVWNEPIYTPFINVSGAPTDPFDGQWDTTTDLNYQHILQTSHGSHIIDVGFTHHRFEWDTPSPHGYRAPDQFQTPGSISKTYPDPNLAGKFIVFPYTATLNDIWPGAGNAQIWTDPYNSPIIPEHFIASGLAHGWYQVDTDSVYVNDLWSINNNHSVMLGLRQDKLKGSDVKHTVISYTQFTPRFEYKFDIGGDQKRVINVSYAKFHQPLNGGVILPFIESRKAYQRGYYWTGAADPSPNAANPNAPYLVSLAQLTNPANYTHLAYYSAPGVDQIDPKVKGMTDTEWTVGYRRNFDNGGSIRITYINRNWENLYDWFPDTKGTVFQDPSNPNDPNAQFTALRRTLAIDSNAHRRYKALELEWNLPLAHRLTYGGNYSYARFTGNDNENLTSNPDSSVRYDPSEQSNWNSLYYNYYYAQAGAVPNPDQLRRSVHHLNGWFVFDCGTAKVKQSVTLRFNYTSGSPFSPTQAYAIPGINDTPTPGGVTPVSGYDGNRLPSNRMYLPIGGNNQFTYQGSYGFNLHYALEVPVHRSLVWFFNGDIGNVFQHIVTNGYTPGNYYDYPPTWNPTGAVSPYVGGWRVGDTTGAASKSGFRSMSIESGFRF
ncbi:TonB-dependent receptor [Geothrix limicola]|nr:TonB-dependent receptor [Geothrix limicola]